MEAIGVNAGARRKNLGTCMSLFDTPSAGQQMLIQYLPGNAQGRDFVVGDLHGCRAALDALLAEARFDPACDRVFSVGDLIDRGPDSHGCVALLNEPWFFACRGNHEQMFIDAYQSLAHGSASDSYEVSMCLLNGGNWAVEGWQTGAPWLADYAAKFAKLPHLLIVGEGARRFHVLHAELWSVENDLSDAWIDAGFLEEDSRYIDRLLWSRSLMIENPPPDAPAGLSPVYCGHTPQTAVKHAYGHINLDTGCFIPVLTGRRHRGAHGLTLLQAGSDKCWFFDGDRLLVPAVG